MQIVLKSIAVMVLAIFAGGLFVSLFSLSHAMQQDMAGATPMQQHCPFMTHGEVFCPMDVLGHLAAWQQMLLTMVPVWVLVVVSALATTSTLPPQVWHRILYILSVPARQYRERTYTFIYRKLQEFFASGILNPKLF